VFFCCFFFFFFFVYHSNSNQTLFNIPPNHRGISGTTATDKKEEEEECLVPLPLSTSYLHSNSTNNNNLRFPKPFAHFSVSNSSSFSVGPLFSISTNHRFLSPPDSRCFDGSRFSSSPFNCSALKSQPSVSLADHTITASRKNPKFLSFFVNFYFLIIYLLRL
jgi:hypothetical protein